MWPEPSRGESGGEKEAVHRSDERPASTPLSANGRTEWRGVLEEAQEAPPCPTLPPGRSKYVRGSVGENEIPRDGPSSAGRRRHATRYVIGRRGRAWESRRRHFPTGSLSGPSAVGRRAARQALDSGGRRPPLSSPRTTTQSSDSRVARPKGKKEDTQKKSELFGALGLVRYT